MPWHLYATYLYGGHFWHDYLFRQVVMRAATDVLGTHGAATLYIHDLMLYAWPWAPLFLIAMVVSFDQYRRVHALVFASILSTLALFIAIEAMQTKVVSYLVPLYPFIALALGSLVASLSPRPRDEWVAIEIVCV